MTSGNQENPYSRAAHSLINIDRDQAITQLEALGYSRGDAVYVRAFLPKEDPRSGPNTGRKADKLNWKQVERWQAEGYGIYIVVNGGGHKDSDVEFCRALFCEFDDRPIEDQINFWQDLGLPEPTMQIATRKSVHTYWVLDSDIPVDQWRELQAAILAYTGSDPTLKNPSRVMRLAGAYHIKPGCDPLRCDIINQSGKRYSYEELCAAIPVPQPEPVVQSLVPPVPQLEPTSQPVTTAPKYQRYEAIEIPVPSSVPLYQCLSKESRALIDFGVSEGSRNSSGAKLARDLIGTANHLQTIGQHFDGDPRRLLDDYASRCTPTLDAKEVSALWKSAEKDRPGPSCKADGVEACIRGWYWNNHVLPNQPTGGRGFGSPRNEATTSAPPARLPLSSVLPKVTEILGGKHSEPQEAILLEEIRIACGMSSYDFEKKIVKPLKRDLEVSRYKAELLYLLSITDPIERDLRIGQIAPRYQLGRPVVERNLIQMKAQTTTTEATDYALDEFFDLESEALEWIVPGMLPAGETVLVVAVPKCGKTLMGIDLAFAVATGESDFLGEQVRQGRVLIVSVDESAKSTKSKLLRRGLRREDAANIRVMTKFDMTQLPLLEERLEAFRPTLVIIDSLRRINAGRDVSENSAEFADTIYALKELLTRYNAAGLLVHHSCKDREALGVNKVRGSSAIAGAAWGIWQLDHIPQPDPNNKKKLIIDPKDPHRLFAVTARDAEGQTLNVELDLENNHWVNRGELGSSSEAAAERKTHERRILELLTDIAPKGLEGAEIDYHLNIGRGIYSVLNRMEGKRLITSRPSTIDRRRTVYALPGNPGNDSPPPDEPGGGGSTPTSGGDGSPTSHADPEPLDNESSFPPPSPSPTPAADIAPAESFTQQGTEDRTQLDHISQSMDHIFEALRGDESGSNAALVVTPGIEHMVQSQDQGGVSEVLTEEMQAILELMQSVYSTSEMQALDSEVVQLGITPEQKQLIWGRLDKETQQRLQRLHRQLKLERSRTTAGLGFGALAPNATKPSATISRASQTQTQASTSSQASLTPAETEEPATQSTFNAPKIQVGRRVYWDNCPGHFASWNPFTVTAIEGDSARLDFVVMLVPVAELRLVE